MSKKKVEAKAVVDDHHEIHRPLDFSFKAVSSFPDLLKEKPRCRGKQLQGVLVLEDELSAGDSSTSVEVVQMSSTAMRVNNNMIASWDGFLYTVDRLLVDPGSLLQWLDLSFNDLKTIDNALLELPMLTMLYIHGNNIGRIAEVDKLSSLSRLKSLALHGNPIEVTPGYRHYVLSRLPQLQTFDFGGITKADRATAETWTKMIAPKQKPKKKKVSED